MGSSTSPGVTVVLTNWKRPLNLNLITDAFLDQTVRPTVVIVDNAEVETDGGFWHLYADEVIVARNSNYGPPCRFLAIPIIKTKYTLFYDDDMLPGKMAIEHLLEKAADCSDKFSTIGSVGRLYDGTHVVKKNIKTQGELRAVDLTCRAHFCLTKHLYNAIYCQHALRGVSDESMLRNDDIILCQSVQLGHLHPSYITQPADKARRLNLRNLPAEAANCARPDHVESRDRLVGEFAKLGWRTLV